MLMVGASMTRCEDVFAQRTTDGSAMPRFSMKCLKCHQMFQRGMSFPFTCVCITPGDRSLALANNWHCRSTIVFVYCEEFMYTNETPED